MNRAQSFSGIPMKNARQVLLLATTAIAPKEVNSLYLKLIRQDTFLWVREQRERLSLNRFNEWLDKQCDGGE